MTPSLGPVGAVGAVGAAGAVGAVGAAVAAGTDSERQATAALLAAAERDGTVDGTVSSSDGGGPTLATLVGLLLVLVGVRLGLQPLGDNSFLTHLATGRLILEDLRVPTTDPYTFTAAGTPWTVQSWLASVWYAALEEVAGLRAIQFATAAATGCLVALVWRLARPSAALLARTAVVGLVVLVGATGWSERPYLYGLVFLALVLLAAEGGLRPRWLVPVFWLWVNVHGSFVLGLGLLVLVALGHRMDRGSWGVEVRCLKAAALGVMLGAVNPLGLKLLVFPFTSMTRNEQLAQILEWQAPTFTGWGQRAFLVLVVLAIVALVRRPSWRAAMPVAVFTVLALLAARNVVVASVVLVPFVAVGLGDLGDLRCDRRFRLGRPVVAALAVLLVLLPVSTLGRPVMVHDAYPVTALEWLERRGGLGPRSRVVTPDYVGNWLELHRPGTPTFLDDRADMFPAGVIDDVLVLRGGRPGWSEVLQRWAATAVVWQSDSPLATILSLSPDWRVVYGDDEWIVAVPATSTVR